MSNTQTQTESIHLLEETRNALQSVRKALIELYGVIGADPSVPQEVARRLGMNRNLSWKLSRVINAPEPFATLNHLPGNQGLELAISAFEQAGAPSEAVDQVRAALKAFTGVIETHAGDREHLELTLESMGAFERETSADSGRELAYRGNSAIWGVQARTRMGAYFLGPSKDNPGTVDFVGVAGLIGFRRLRPSVRWRMYRAQLHDDKGGNLRPLDSTEEIEPTVSGQIPMMIREFCSANTPRFELVPGPQGHEFVLPGGQVGNTAVFDSYFGYIFRGLPGARGPNNEVGSVAAMVTLPVQWIVFDLVYHRSVTIPSKPEVLVYGFPQGGPDDPSNQTEENLLPIVAHATELAGSPPALATPLVPKLTKMAERIYARMGWNPSEFRGLRVQIPFPPMSSRLVVRWKLPESGI